LFITYALSNVHIEAEVISKTNRELLVEDNYTNNVVTLNSQMTCVKLPSLSNSQ